MKIKAPSIDSVTTINEDGSRYFVHPADVHGPITRWRRCVAVLLIAIYIALPIIQIRGAPAVFLDIFHRKLHLFGMTLMLQDLWLLFFFITGLGFTLFFVTSIIGRVWCGWVCPQTVFLDHVFRRIERFIDGNALERRKLDAAPWTFSKILRRLVKHTIYFLLAALIAHIFLSYFVSLPELYRMMHQSPAANWGKFLFVFALAGILYFNFSWFREQFCIVLCPYGRLQSALIDDNSIVIGYDYRRGEPRGKPSKTSGDCIDCRRCVQVCPTGIDIRQGLQMECISCASCIDACNEVMRKLGRPGGLIRHTSLNVLAGKVTRFWRPRTVIYLVLSIIGATVFSLAATQVKPVTLSVLRMQGAPYFRDEGQIRNNFLLRLANKRSEPHTYTVTIQSSQEGVKASGVVDHKVVLNPSEEKQEPLILMLPDHAFHGTFNVTVQVRGKDGAVEVEKTVPFLGPFRG